MNKQHEHDEQPDPLEWQDCMLTGHSSIDAMHLDFVKHLNALIESNDEGLAASLNIVVSHLKRHFSEEDALMERTDFPAIDCHTGEHGAVLASAHEVMSDLRLGNIDQVRRFAKALRDWFPMHITYLDSALSAWAVRKESGGVPVVIQRKIKRQDSVAEDMGNRFN